MEEPRPEPDVTTAVIAKLMALELLVSNAWIRLARDEAERRGVDVGANAREINVALQGAVVDLGMPAELQGMVRGQVGDVMNHVIGVADLMDAQKRLKPR